MIYSGMEFFLNGVCLKKHISAGNVIIYKRENLIGNSFELHLHDDWEMKVLAQTGIILIPPRTVHPVTRSEQRNFSFYAEKDNADVVYSGRKRTEYHKLNSFYHAKLEELCMAAFSQLCEKISTVFQNRPNGSDAKYAEALLSLFFSSLAIVLECWKNDPEAKVQSKVEKAVQYINRYYFRHGLSVKEIASSVSVTPNYLVTLFKAERGMDISSTLALVRLRKAYKLLKTRKFAVKEVAEFTGWNSQFYFANCFRKHYKITPSSLLEIKSR